jgi:sulfoxide reductase heme-binding subunit YedZ
MTHDPTFWLLARSSGTAAYVLLTLSVVAGIVVKSRPFGHAVRQPTVVDAHRFLALLGLGFLGAHCGALVLDETVEISPAALVVPGLASYRPLATALGVVAANTMLLVYVSFALRRHIGHRTWRRLHWATYGVFASATAHGVLAGTDSATSWAQALYLGAIGAVAVAAAWRALPTATRRVAVPKEEG